MVRKCDDPNMIKSDVIEGIRDTFNVSQQISGAWVKWNKRKRIKWALSNNKTTKGKCFDETSYATKDFYKEQPLVFILPRLYRLMSHVRTSKSRNLMNWRAISALWLIVVVARRTSFKCDSRTWAHFKGLKKTILMTTIRKSCHRYWIM